MSRPNQNLTKSEAAILREIAAHHGYAASTGPHRGQGSALALQLAVITGDVVIVSIDSEDRRLLADWLTRQAETAPAPLAALIGDLAADLAYGLVALPPLPPGDGGDVGSINTLEG